jgi:alpha-tubulin suppressor-like RCC1 family protein
MTRTAPLALFVVLAIGACTPGPDRVRVAASETSDPSQMPSAPRHDVLLPASGAPVVQVSTGMSHACAVHADGTGSCWGSNRWGQIAPDHRTARRVGPAYATPEAAIVAPVGAPVRDILEIVAADDRTCARRADGVWCWGGAVGGVTHIRETAGAVEITGDCARFADKPARCWADLDVAEEEPVLANAIDLAFAHRMTCGLDAGGGIGCWAPPGQGYYRDEVKIRATRNVPGAVEIGIAGEQRMCVRLASGAVDCYSIDPYGGGYDDYGNARVVNDLHRVAGVTGAVSLSVSQGFGCAVDATKAVRCWGNDVPGQPWGQLYVSREIDGLRADEIDVGVTFACARTGGELACWGSNGSGELGAGWASVHPAPIDVPGIDDAVDVHAGNTFTCARRRSGAVACWGHFYDQNTANAHADPRAIPSAHGAVELSGLVELCARFPDGDVRCGQPPVGRMRGVARRALDLDADISNNAVVRADGTVLSWGFNDFGQFGDGAPDSGRGVMKGVRDAIAVAVGDSQTCIVRADRTVSCLGSQVFGGSSLSPVPVSGADDVVQLELGTLGGCARRGDGTVRCFGSNVFGQLGDGSTRDTPVAIEVSGLADVVDISAGTDSVCAVRADHTVWCWGDNRTGVLGADPLVVASAPRPRQILDDAVAVSVAAHACAVRTSGKVTCWGQAVEGQLGTVVAGYSRTAVPVAFPGTLD